MALNCPYCEKGIKNNSQSALNVHIKSKHPDKFENSEKGSSVGKGEGKPTSFNDSKIPTTKDRETPVISFSNKDFNEGDDYPDQPLEDEQLYNLIRDFGHKDRAGGIIRQMKIRGNLSDLDSLNDVLTFNGITLRDKQGIIDSWARSTGKGIPNKLREKLEMELKPEEESNQEYGPTAPKPGKLSPMDRLEQELDALKLKSMQEAEKALQMVSLVKQLKNAGLDPNEFGLGQYVKKEEPGPDDEILTYTFPPGTNQIVKMRSKEFMDRLAKWNQTNQTQSQFTQQNQQNKQEEMREYEWPPGSSLKAMLRPSDYSQMYNNWLTHNSQNNEKNESERRLAEQKKESDQRFEEMRKDFQEALDRMDRQNKELIEKLDTKDKEQQKMATENLKKEVEELKSRNPIREARENITDLKENAKSLGMKEDQGPTVEEQAFLDDKKTTNAVVRELAGTANKKLETSGKSREGIINTVSKILESRGPQIVDRILSGPNAQPIPPPIIERPTEEQLKKVNEVLKAELGELDDEDNVAQ